MARLEAMVANGAVPASVAAAQAAAPAASVPAAAQQPTLISGARAAAPAASAAPAATSAPPPAVCLGTVVLLFRLPSLRPVLRPCQLPSLQRLHLSLRQLRRLSPLRPPRLPPLRHLSPSPTMPPRLPPPVLPRRPRSMMPESCSANGPRLSSVSRRVRLPTQGFCSTLAPRPTTAPSSRSRSPRARPLP